MRLGIACLWASRGRAKEAREVAFLHSVLAAAGLLVLGSWSIDSERKPGSK
jgi:hypothetical protein